MPRARQPKQSYLAKLDTRLSRKFLFEEAVKSPSIRLIFLLIEWSAHGIPWLLISGFGVLFSIRWNKSYWIQYQWCVLLFGIVIDLIFVGLIKISVQRSRPPYNTDDQVYEAPIADKFSFPSGHSSRAAMLAVLGLTFLAENSNVLRFLTTLFPFFLGFTRIAMGRHYLFDVVAGLLLGLIEGNIALLLPEQTPELLRVHLSFIFAA